MVSSCFPKGNIFDPIVSQEETDLNPLEGRSRPIYMIESASYVFDPEILGFFEATSTQQLVSGEGIAGKALGTNQQLAVYQFRILGDRIVPHLWFVAYTTASPPCSTLIFPSLSVLYHLLHMVMFMNMLFLFDLRAVSFGTVYKGYIDENVRVGLKSLPVAVKIGVNFLVQLRHPNLVKLIGYCCEDDHILLVNEFMFRGSLENHLFRMTERKLYKSEDHKKNIRKVPVPALKEHIASITVVLSEQQRLIYRGKVLKDDQLLSAYLLHGKVVHKVGVVSIGVGGLKLTKYLKEQLRLRDLHVSSLYTIRSLKEAVADCTKRCYVAKMRTDHTWFRTVVLAGGTACLPGLPDIQVDDENIVPRPSVSYDDVP
ncbi:unnamed protein product [Lactuca saligna]|uniref:Ubiquitin-like domain-containing protein n=1 Tax=Lactuca saligna TaxID=75948 RepID=A0AA35ZBX8_LACSI|nr:unnamed protein product [Lactuca saligna]